MTTILNTQSLQTICKGLATSNLTASDDCFIEGRLLEWVERQADLLDEMGDAPSWDESPLMPWAPMEDFDPEQLWGAIDDHGSFACRVFTMALERLESKLLEQGVDLKGLRLAELI